MDNLPKDPVMLLSFMNLKLRDMYAGLGELAEGLDISDDELQEIVEKLAAIDYHYDAGRNQFV